MITMNENNITTRSFRDQLEAASLQQISNEVEDTLLMQAPEDWSDEQCEGVEERVLDHTRLVLSALSTLELRSSGALRTHICQAIAETKRLIHLGGVQKES